MRLLFLRSFVPKDKNPKEAMYDNLDSSNDVWEHIACALGDERAEIVYIGGTRNVRYSEKAGVSWFKDIDSINIDFPVDVVFARGGFREWVQVCKKFPEAKRAYYGAGARIIPEHGKWDYVLCDTEVQRQKLINKGYNAVLWCKPAAPMFAPVATTKLYDVCYVGDGRFPFRDDIKRVSWFYKHVPKELKCLHLGWSGVVPPPKNVTVMRVPRSEMPLYYSKCKVLVVPYREYDSAPRVIPEALACGLNVVALDTVNFNNQNKVVYVTTKDKLWSTVWIAMIQPQKHYTTFNESVDHLRKAIT